MPPVLITGANGFLGHYLSAALVPHMPVVATGKGGCRLPGTGFIYRTLDFTNEEQIALLMEEFRPGMVIHCGAISKPDECELNPENAYRVNMSGTLSLLRHSEKWRSHFIFLSTDFVFDGLQGMYREEDARNPVNYYGKTKMLAEDEVMKFPYGWTIARTILVYGRPFGGRDNLVSNVAASLAQGESLRVFSDQIRTPTYVEDLASALVAMARGRHRGIFHISGEDRLTPYRMAMETAEYLGRDTSLIIPVTEKEWQQPARRPPVTGFDISKAKRLLDFRPLSFREGLGKMFADI